MCFFQKLSELGSRLGFGVQGCRLGSATFPSMLIKGHLCGSIWCVRLRWLDVLWFDLNWFTLMWLHAMRCYICWSNVMWFTVILCVLIHSRWFLLIQCDSRQSDLFRYGLSPFDWIQSKMIRFGAMLFALMWLRVRVSIWFDSVSFNSIQVDFIWCVLTWLRFTCRVSLDWASDCFRAPGLTLFANRIAPGDEGGPRKMYS